MENVMILVSSDRQDFFLTLWLWYAVRLVCRLARSPLVCCCTPAGVGMDRSRVANSSAAALFFSYTELKTSCQQCSLKTSKFHIQMCYYFWRKQRIKSSLFTFSLEEPTAKQLSKDSRELTTNLKLRKNINSASTADFALNQPIKQKKEQISTCCSLCWSKCQNNTECKNKCFQEKKCFCCCSTSVEMVHGMFTVSGMDTQTGTHAQNHTNKQRKGSY